MNTHLKTNKYAKPKENIKTTLQFQYRWFGERVPETITFPDGKKNKVIHMRDGKIIFENGNSGTYSRWDDKKTQERIISLALEVD